MQGIVYPKIAVNLLLDVELFIGVIILCLNSRSLMATQGLYPFLVEVVGLTTLGSTKLVPSESISS